MVVDTMVMAYAQLSVPEYGMESATALARLDEMTAPASVEAELLNVVWQWGRRSGNVVLAAQAYDNASRLWTELLPVEMLWPVALTLAMDAGHSPYDTLFVAAARMRNTRVLTYDKKMLALFPDDTLRVSIFLG